MNKPNRGNIADARLLTIQQACEYTGMGRTKCANWCAEIGAVKRFGSMVRYDKHVIDAALNEMTAQLAQ